MYRVNHDMDKYISHKMFSNTSAGWPHQDTDIHENYYNNSDMSQGRKYVSHKTDESTVWNTVKVCRARALLLKTCDQGVLEWHLSGAAHICGACV